MLYVRHIILRGRSAGVAFPTWLYGSIHVHEEEQSWEWLRHTAVIDFVGTPVLNVKLDGQLHVATLLVCQDRSAGTSHTVKSVRLGAFFDCA